MEEREVVGVASVPSEQAPAVASTPASPRPAPPVPEPSRAPKALLSYIDATRCGSMGRFVNHSCAPNLEARTVRVGHAAPHLSRSSPRETLARVRR